MKQIPITQGKFVTVDDVDFEFLTQWKWCFSNGTAVRKTSYSGVKKNLYMRQAIAERTGLYEKPVWRFLMYITHKDGNSLNCQRDNLIVVPPGGQKRSKYALVHPIAGSGRAIIWKIPAQSNSENTTDLRAAHC